MTQGPARRPHEEGLVRRTMPSPVGWLTIVASDRGVRAVLMGDEADEAAGIPEPPAAGSPAASNLSAAVRQLEEYFAGVRREFDLPLDPVGTDFQRRVWTELCRIPFGATISYGEQARRIGAPNASRAVGAANGRNPIAIIVPCHRVVGADGGLTGYASGVERKAWLLQHEHGGMLPL